MIKKITTLLVAAFLICGLSGIAMAQAQQIDAEGMAGLEAVAEMYKDQKPVTDTEVKAYIEILPKLKEAQNDATKAIALINSSGMDQIRFSYVGMKIPFTMLAITKEPGWEMINDLPAILKPTDEEIKLIGKYKDELTKGLEELTKNLNK